MSAQLHTKFETHPSLMTLPQINKCLHRTLVPEYIWYFAGTKIIQSIIVSYSTKKEKNTVRNLGTDLKSEHSRRGGKRIPNLKTASYTTTKYLITTNQVFQIQLFFIKFAVTVLSLDQHVSFL